MPNLNSVNAHAVPGNFHSVAYKWFCHLDFLDQLATLYRYVDFGCSVPFVHTFFNEPAPLVYFACGSLIVTAMALFVMTYCEILHFRAYGSANAYRKKEQRVFKQRWTLMVFFPLQDIVILGMAIYRFVQEDKSKRDVIIAGICIIISGASILAFVLVPWCFETLGYNDLNDSDDAAQETVSGEAELTSSARRMPETEYSV